MSQQDLMLSQTRNIVNKLMDFGFERADIQSAIQEYGVKFNIWYKIMI